MKISLQVIETINFSQKRSFAHWLYFMTNQELARELMAIYVAGQSYNTTARIIISYLEKDNPKLAMNEYSVDGDKLARYTTWGRKFTELIHNELGCRIHNVKKCDKQFCKINNS